MNALARQQLLLVRALFDRDFANAIKTIAKELEPMRLDGLKVYQSNGHALAERAFAAAYPVLSALLGAQSSAALARTLWHAQPPTCGDVNRWGAGVAAFVRADPQLQDTPYLADVAQLEWALHCCASAADGSPQPASLALLAQQAPEALFLEWPPGTVLLPSAWPVVSIVGAHRDGVPGFATVAAELQAGVAQTALVWRQAWRPSLRSALPGEAAFLRATQTGASLGQALDAAPALDFAQWLPRAVQEGLLLSVRCAGGA